VPLYFQLAQRLRSQIAQNLLKAGDPLPTEEQLCSMYSVSRITVRRATDDLIMEQLVVRKRGVGTFVGERKGATRSVSLVGSLYEALSYPRGISIDIAARGETYGPPWVTKALLLPPRTKVYFCEALSWTGTMPFAATTFYFPVFIGERLPYDRINGDTPVAHLVEHLLGEPVVRAAQTVEPTTANRSVSSSLRLPRDTPLLHVRRTYFTASERPVEAVSVHYHPDHYQLKIDLLPTSQPAREGRRAGP
jgi:GntR family transcriptional regulator